MDIYKELLYHRFGGEVLWFQQLEDWGRAKVPRPLFPLWKRFVDWLHRLTIRWQIWRTMQQVDIQAKQIGDDWAQHAEVEMISKAVDAATKEFPDATVEVIRPGRQDQGIKPPPAILITKPPDPNSRVQMTLGFGELEIRAPWHQPPS